MTNLPNQILASGGTKTLLLEECTLTDGKILRNFKGISNIVTHVPVISELIVIFHLSFNFAYCKFKICVI
jgi:hypothetical protein